MDELNHGRPARGIAVLNLPLLEQTGPLPETNTLGGSMKRVLTSITTAIALAGFAGIAGCDSDGAGDNGADSVAMHDTSSLDVDSGGGSTEVNVEEREFQFDGTATAVSGDMITIDHKDIGDYKPAGSNQFKLA